MENPYTNLPDKHFWKLAVGSKNSLEIEGLWSPKFNLSRHKVIATYGSCFAQHIGNALSSKGFNWTNFEQAPPSIDLELAKKFSYGIFSARTGNIYTTSLLLQWTEWALGIKKPPEEVWENDGRFFDPFRPSIEPNGFESKEELINSRQQTIQSFHDSFAKSDIFVFTLGLTESWFNKQGYEYPMCPGTIAGVFDSNQHEFQNQSFKQVHQALLSAIRLIKKSNPKLKIILTVSPVPLTATNSDKHVLTATMYSKSVLRAVAGELYDTKRFIDYFPSYEIINSPAFKGLFFEPNQRSISNFGVDFVMNHFFSSLNLKAVASKKVLQKNTSDIIDQQADAACDEEILESFK